MKAMNEKLGLPPPSEEEVMATFVEMDKNNDNKLSPEEVKAMFVDMIIAFWTKKEEEAFQQKLNDKEENSMSIS